MKRGKDLVEVCMIGQAVLIRLGELLPVFFVYCGSGYLFLGMLHQIAYTLKRTHHCDVLIKSAAHGRAENTVIQCTTEGWLL
jgi:hypothetical protein